MSSAKSASPNPFYRCAGPNCGILKAGTDHWWIMWTSFDEHHIPVLHTAPWDEEVAMREGALHVCGEGCAQKLQSHFMGNVLENKTRKSGSRER